MNKNIIPLTISPEIIQKIAEIEKLIGRIEGIKLTKPTPKLRKNNLIKSVQGSTGIEGNSCTVEQVQAIINKQPVPLSQKEQLEIKNAIDTYNIISEFDRSS